MADRDGDTVTVISAVKECNRSGMSLLKALRDAGIERDYAYDLLKSAIFEEQLDKPEVFFAYGEDANEFEAALQAVYRELGAPAFENEAVEAAAENFLSPVRIRLRLLPTVPRLLCRHAARPDSY